MQKPEDTEALVKRAEVTTLGMGAQPEMRPLLYPPLAWIPWPASLHIIHVLQGPAEILSL